MHAGRVGWLLAPLVSLAALGCAIPVAYGRTDRVLDQRALR